jgi:signal recognition particle subunit SRP68
VLLFNCERLWAASHVLQSGETARSAHRSHQKLSRAVQQTDALLALTAHPRVVDRISLSHRAQTTIYHLLLRGTLAFERGAHEEGVKVLGVAWTLCHTVSSKAETAEEEALVNEVIDEVEPMLRFCAYTLQRDVEGGVGEVARGAADEFGETVVQGWKALVGALEEGEGREREAVEIVWRGKEVPVRNVQLVDVVGKVQSALKSLEKDDTGKGKDMLGARRMGTFDRVLGALTDKEGVARQLVEDNQVSTISAFLLGTSLILGIDCIDTHDVGSVRSVRCTASTSALVHPLPPPRSPHEARPPPHLHHALQARCTGIQGYCIRSSVRAADGQAGSESARDEIEEGEG